MGTFVFRPARATRVEISGIWLKSSLSVYNGNCVEVAGLADDTIWVRDSKNPHGGVLNFTPAQWDAFIAGVFNGEFDRDPAVAD